MTGRGRSPGGWPSGWIWHLLLVTSNALVERAPAVEHLVGPLRLRRLRRSLARQERRDDVHPASLRWSERSVFSQNGEDGIIAELFRRVGVSSRCFVEIGASDGEENCTRALAEEGWSGLWVEADEEDAASAAKVAPAGVTVVPRRAERGSVASLLRDHGAPADLDLLVVDIDSDDLGVAVAVLCSFSPRVVVVEYNAVFPPYVRWTVDPTGRTGWDRTFRHGASLLALCSALEVAGYDVVACDRSGVNAFFVRRDLLPLASFDPPPGGPRRHQRLPQFSGLAFGHPRSRRAVQDMEPLAAGELTSIRLGDLRVVTADRRSAALAAGGFVGLAVVVTNGARSALSSGGPAGFHLSVQWSERQGSPSPADAPRCQLPVAVPPSSARCMYLWTRAPLVPGRHVLRVTGVQEGVGWLDLLGPGGLSELVVDVA